MGVLVALPGLWVDHDPGEIATGLMGVLVSVLQLDGVYARFDQSEGTNPIEVWSPTGPSAPSELLHVLVVDGVAAPNVVTLTVDEGGPVTLHVLSLRLEWHSETALVLTSSTRDDFPTIVETHLLRAAVSQAAIAIHTARRLILEHTARAEAEHLLSRQNDILRSMVDDVEPSIRSLSRRVHEVSRAVAEIDASQTSRADGRVAGGFPHDAVEAAPELQAVPPVSRREREVLGLLARGLSNKEIAGVMWLSDRTVERHITSLYRKIGVARRSEATVFALRHGVV